jgi:hypothetical protein
MSLKLIKTNTLAICLQCQGANFIRFGLGWSCEVCGTYVPIQLINDIKR